MLSFKETKNRLKLLPFDYRGQGKNKTLKLQDPELFEAVYYWSQPLESKMKECGRYASSYNFSHRVMFILDKDGNVIADPMTRICPSFPRAICVYPSGPWISKNPRRLNRS